MRQFLRNKRGQSLAGTRNDPMVRAQQQVARATTAEAVELAKSRRGPGIWSRVEHALWGGVNWSRKFMLELIVIITKPISGLSAHAVRVLLTAILCTAVVIFSTGFVWPGVQHVAFENDLNTPEDWMQYMKYKSGLVKIPQMIQTWEQRWQAELEGTYVTPDVESSVRYGIFLNTLTSSVAGKDNLVTPGARKMDFKTRVSAPILDLKGVDLDEQVYISCFLEDSDDPEILPAEQIEIRHIPGKQIECIFPMPRMSDKRLREASITINYSFASYADMPVTVMETDEYDTKLEGFLMRNQYDYDRAIKELAESIGIKPDQGAITKNTPVIIGAEIADFQPIMQSERRHTLKVTIQNQGEGIADLKSLQILTADGLEIDTEALGEFSPFKFDGRDTVTFVGEDPDGKSTKLFLLDDNEFRTLSVWLKTNNMKISNPPGYLTTKIGLIANYVYEVSESKNFRFETCDSYPEADGCGEEDTEESTQTELEPDTTPQTAPTTTAPTAETSSVGCCWTQRNGKVECSPSAEKDCVEVEDGARLRVVWDAKSCSDIPSCG
ncbi:hypothetical protein KY320_03470 [Candidatus Woesearchaeota archaeon]|nr:hypothetical protein [Candidatus Woesearchaeota archaeon]